jgi:Holliday junction resolvase
MANRNYERGVRWERELKAKWEEKGYTVVRTAGSHGPWDLVAIHPERPVELIQCKVLKYGGSKQAYMMIRKFKQDPPLAPSKFYHQTMAVKAMGDNSITEGTV